MAEVSAGAPTEATYDTIFTLIHDLGEGRDIARIEGSVWPPVGTVIELEAPERHALVVGIRLALLESNTVVVRVDVQDPGEGELIARDAATRLLESEPLTAPIEPATLEVEAPTLPIE